jgi:hypothetical protein
MALHLATLEVALAEWAACSEPGGGGPLAVLEDPLAALQLADEAAAQADATAAAGAAARDDVVPAAAALAGPDGAPVGLADPVGGSASESAAVDRGPGRKLQGLLGVLEVVHLRSSLRLGLLELDTLRR